jgi:hypothetical protein
MDEYLMYSDNDILERVDEYSLYCHYLKFEPLIGKKYSSPIRLGDTDPSFAIFERKYGNGCSEYLWKDQAVGTHGPQDIFDLIMALDNTIPTRIYAMWKVCGDFNLGGAPGMPDGKLIFKEAQFVEPINIKIVSRQFNKRDLLYWAQFNVVEPILKAYNATALEAYWLVDSQQYPSYPKRNMGYSYRIFDKYQLYFPFADKKKKFRNNWIDSCIPGLSQLQGNDLCIITKSYKDVMSLRSFGIDAISPRGENIMLPTECIAYLQRRYKRTVTLFDNDDKHKAAFYPFQELHIPIETGQKDPTDYCSAYGPKATKELLNHLLCAPIGPRLNTS